MPDSSDLHPELPPTAPPPQTRPPKASARTASVVLALTALAAGIVISVFASRMAQAPQSNGGPPTAARYDAMARYEAARRARRPVYVLFHSVT